MNTTKLTYYLLPLFLLFLMVVSLLLNTNLFVNGEYTFAVWFIIMLAAFSGGRVMSSAFNRSNGTKTILIVTVIAAIVDIGIVSVFPEKFSVHNTLIGNLVLYGLRVVVLGFSAFFGLIYGEVIKYSGALENKGETENGNADAKVQAEFFIKQARLKAEKIIFDAQKEAGQIKENKERLEIELRQLIQTEREVIRQYENDEINDKEENVE